MELERKDTQHKKRKIENNFENVDYLFGRADAVLPALQLAAERPTATTLLIFLVIPLSSSSSKKSGRKEPNVKI